MILALWCVLGFFAYVAGAAITARLLEPKLDGYDGPPRFLWIMFWPICAAIYTAGRTFNALAYGKLPTKEERAERKQRKVEEREREAERAYERATRS